MHDRPIDALFVKKDGPSQARAAQVRPIEVIKMTELGHEFVCIFMPTGSGLRLTPEQARELYDKMGWLFRDEPVKGTPT